MVLLTVAATVAACAQNDQSDGLIQFGQFLGGATKQIADVQPVAGFLPKPSLLHPGAAGEAALVFRDQTAKFTSYDKVLLDPVAIWAAPGSDLSNAAPDRKQALANAFYAYLYHAIAARCQMVTKPSPGTVHIRTALVDTTSPDPMINTIATFAPYASTAYSVTAFAFNKGVGYFAGTATAESYATDATSGVLLWQAVDKRGGTTALVENTLDRWLDVHHIFEVWSEKLAAMLQQFGACP